MKDLQSVEAGARSRCLSGMFRGLFWHDLMRLESKGLEHITRNNKKDKISYSHEMKRSTQQNTSVNPSALVKSNSSSLTCSLPGTHVKSHPWQTNQLQCHEYTGEPHTTQEPVWMISIAMFEYISSRAHHVAMSATGAVTLSMGIHHFRHTEVGQFNISIVV